MSGRRLREALEQVQILKGTRPKRAFVDRGYRGRDIQTTAVYFAGQKSELTLALRRDMRRRSAIEPVNGQMKTNGRLYRCAPRSTLGDALHAVLCCCGHNIRIVLAHLRALWAEILVMLMAAFNTSSTAKRSKYGAHSTHHVMFVANYLHPNTIARNQNDALS